MNDRQVVKYGLYFYLLLSAVCFWADGNGKTMAHTYDCMSGPDGCLPSAHLYHCVMKP
jgi:hypothetical protein